MKRRNADKKFLRIILILHLAIILPIMLRKPPLKDWLLVYVFNALTNGLLDKILTKYKILNYPVRLVPKLFNINVLFDFLVYPIIAVIHNQMTVKDKLFPIIYKLLFFTVPIYIFESWAVRKTNLIKWNKGWKGYHSFVGLTIKSLITRFLFGIFRLEN